MTASPCWRHARHGLTGPGLPYTTLRDSTAGAIWVVNAKNGVEWAFCPGIACLLIS